MASATELCNSALVLIGDFRINSLDEGSELSRRCAERYDRVRLRLLRSHTWNFAAKQVQLARNDVDPVYEFEYSYALPADYVRLRALDTQPNGNSNAEYRIQGRNVFSDFPTLYLSYTSDVKDVSLFPPDFYDAFAYALAGELAIPVAQSISLQERMDRKGGLYLKRAKSADSLEDYSDALPAGTWNDYRYIGVGRSFRRRT